MPGKADFIYLAPPIAMPLIELESIAPEGCLDDICLNDSGPFGVLVFIIMFESLYNDSS